MRNIRKHTIQARHRQLTRPQLHPGLRVALFCVLGAACGPPQETNGMQGGFGGGGNTSTDREEETTGRYALVALERAREFTTGTKATDCSTLHFHGQDFSTLGVQCVTSTVPLDWTEPEGEKIEVLTMVKRSTSNSPKGTFYLLEGGPGGVGLKTAQDVQEEDSYVQALLQAGWDIAIPAPRGTLTSAVTCPTHRAAQREAQEKMCYAEDDTGAATTTPPITPGCLDEATQKALDAGFCQNEVLTQLGGVKKRLGLFRTTDAVVDIVAQTPSIHRGGQRIALGMSYGTWVAQRLAQMYPKTFDKIILDSVLPLGPWVFQATYHDEMLKDILASCLQDSGCASKLQSTSVEAAWRATMTAVGELTRCTPSISKRDIFGLLLPLIASEGGRPLVPYAIRNTIDKNCAALRRLLQPQEETPPSDDGKWRWYFAQPPPTSAGFNDILYALVLFSELVDGSQKSTFDMLAEALSAGLLSSEGLYKRVHTLWKLHWNKVSYNPAPKALDDYRAPTLILSARFDFATPVQQARRAQGLLQKHQVPTELYVNQRAAHVTIAHPISEENCSLQRTLWFVNGKAEGDFVCHNPAAIDFAFQDASSKTLARRYTGKDVPW